MPLVAMVEGWRRVLQVFLANETILCFPYRNDRYPRFTDLVSAYAEADFSGYSGAQILGTWSSPAISAQRAITTAAAVTWNHNGGPTNNLIYGVCWVDGANNLLFAERDPRAPIPVSNVPPFTTYAYTPRLSDTTEYPG